MPPKKATTKPKAKKEATPKKQATPRSRSPSPSRSKSKDLHFDLWAGEKKESKVYANGKVKVETITRNKTNLLSGKTRVSYIVTGERTLSKATKAGNTKVRKPTIVSEEKAKEVAKQTGIKIENVEKDQVDKPKKQKRSKKSEESGSEEKPKKKRAPRKKKSEESGSGSEEKPKKPRAPRKKKADDSGSGEEKPKKKRATKKDVLKITSEAPKKRGRPSTKK